jgi:iron-sulfur cluster assembly protein
MFKITDEAAKQVKTASEQSDAAGMQLRIAAKANQDGSIEYGMGFDEERENDVKVANGDVVVIIDPTSNELLEDATMDYVEIEPGQFHFIFMNPLDPNYTPPKKERKKKD